MRARRLASIVLVLAALALVGTPPTHPRAAPRRYNVVVLMSDDQTLESMRVMRRTRISLGRAGATFNNHFVSYPLCCPSRATYLTGQFMHNHGVEGNWPPRGGYTALDSTNTLPVWLENAGYRTTHIGKYLNGYGRRVTPTKPAGWTDWHGSIDPSTYRMYGYRLFENGREVTYGTKGSDYQTDVYRAKAIAAIRRSVAAGKPFFISVGFLAPHDENGVPQPDNPRAAPRHAGALTDITVPPLEDPSFDESDTTDKPSWYQARYGPMQAADRQAVAIRYRARMRSLLAVDEAVHAIVDELDTQGVLDDTYVIYTSDNGFFHGEHRIRQGKFFPYEPSIRVPLLIRGPGIPAGVRSNQYTVNVDLAPTITEVAGARPGRVMDGTSLLSFARSPAKTTPRTILLETGRAPSGADADQDLRAPPGAGGAAGAAFELTFPMYQGVHTRRYAYFEYLDGERELYDLSVDPFQMQSKHLEPTYRSTMLALSRVLDRLRRCRGDSCFVQADIPAPG
jgi:arylsulfatase A-like enzyme